MNFALANLNGFLAILVTIVFYGLKAEAHPQFICRPSLFLLNPDDAKPHPANDTGVEVEMPLGDSYHLGVTTQDGKASGILGENAPPEKVARWWRGEWYLKNQYPGYSYLKEVPWKLIPNPMALSLLEATTRKRFAASGPWPPLPSEIMDSFFTDRRFHGLTIRPLPSDNGARFWENTRYFGRVIRAGDLRKDVDLSPYLRSRVELQSPTSLANLVNGEGEINVELHFRGEKGKHSAGEALESVWGIQRAVGIPQSSVEQNIIHLHLISELPDPSPAWVDRKLFLEIAQRTDLARRTEIASQIYSVLLGNTIQEKFKVEDPAQEDLVTQVWLPQAASTFKDLFSDWAAGTTHDSSRYKIGHAGFHLSGKYEEAKNAWGIQLRALQAPFEHRSYEPSFRSFADAVHSRMGKRDGGIAGDRLLAWAGIVKKTGSTLGRSWGLGIALLREKLGFSSRKKWEVAFGHSYHNAPWRHLSTHASAQIKNKLEESVEGNAGSLESRLESAMTLDYQKRSSMKYRRNLELKMLIYNWAQDPFYFDRPDRLETIREEQLKALEQYRLRPVEENQGLMAKFLIDSGIAQDYMESLGLNLHVEVKSSP